MDSYVAMIRDSFDDEPVAVGPFCNLQRAAEYVQVYLQERKIVSDLCYPLRLKTPKHVAADIYRNNLAAHLRKHGDI